MSSRTKSLIAAFFILFLDNFGYAITFPLFPILLNAQFELPTDSARHVYLGLLVAAFPCAQFVGAPFWGELADRFGRKKTLFWSLTGTICGYFLTAGAITYGSYIFLILSRLVTGFFAGNLCICMAFIADMYFGKKSRSRNFGYVAVCLGLSWMVALFVGSIVNSPSHLFSGLGLLSLLSLFALITLLRETVIPKNNDHLNFLKGIHQLVRVWENKQIRTLLIILSLWFFGFFIAVQWAAPHSISKFHTESYLILKLLLALGLLWTLGGLLHSWATRYFSGWKIGLWSLFFMSLLYFFGGVTDFFFYFAAAFALSGLFAAFAWSANMSLISLTASPDDQGKSLGSAIGVTAAAQGLGPLFGSIVAGFSRNPVLHLLVAYLLWFPPPSCVCLKA